MAEPSTTCRHCGRLKTRKRWCLRCYVCYPQRPPYKDGKITPGRMAAHFDAIGDYYTGVEVREAPHPKRSR